MLPSGILCFPRWLALLPHPCTSQWQSQDYPLRIVGRGADVGVWRRAPLQVRRKAGSTTSRVTWLLRAEMGWPTVGHAVFVAKSAIRVGTLPSDWYHPCSAFLIDAHPAISRVTERPQFARFTDLTVLTKLRSVRDRLRSNATSTSHRWDVLDNFQRQVFSRAISRIG